MKEYDISIVETLEKTVTVKADSKEAAEEMVREQYYNSEHILDADNFKEVDFKMQDEREINLDQLPKMDVLLVKPGMYPQPVQIGCELEDMQQVIGGEIQDSYPFDDQVAIISDLEGKNKGKELNRGLRLENGDIYDIIVGDFLVVGLTEEDFGSLSPELMEKFEKQFHQPELFVRMGNRYMALPLDDDKVKKPDAPDKLADLKLHKSTHDRDSL